MKIVKTARLFALAALLFSGMLGIGPWYGSLAPLAFTLTIDPQEYFPGDTLKGGGSVANPHSSAIAVPLKAALYQQSGNSQMLKWQRDLGTVLVPPGTSSFALHAVFGVPPVLPNEERMAGHWTLQLVWTNAGTASVVVQAGFMIKLPVVPNPSVESTVQVDVDASKAGRNIATLKKGHNILFDAPVYSHQFYQNEIGYNGALIRLHDGAKFYFDDKKGITRRIEQLLKVGKPDLMFNIFGMPKHLASAFQDNDHDRFGCNRAWATTPPNDYNTWKEYVKGWVTTLKPYGITYWEIWNEPDDQLYPGCFWSGTEDDFFKLYKTTIEAIREAYGGTIPAGVKIGGPAVSVWDGKIRGGTEPLYKTLPRFAQANNLSLDFISWHFYDFGRRRSIVASIPAIKSELVKNGFLASELIIDEYDLSYKNVDDAAAVAVDFMAMAHSGLDRQSLFQFTDTLWAPDFLNGNFNAHKYTGLFGLVDYIIIKPRYNFFKAMHLMGDTIISVTSQPNGVSDYVLALKSTDRVSVMIVNQNAAFSNIKLNIKNVLPQFTKHTKYIIDATHSNAYQFEALIKDKVKQYKKDAAEIAEKPFKEYALKLKIYNQQQISYLWSQVRLVVIGDQSPDQAESNIKNYCSHQGFSPNKCVADMGNSFTSATPIYGTTLNQGIDVINALDGVKLWSESSTIKMQGFTYTETLALAPYSVSVITLSPTPDVASYP